MADNNGEWKNLFQGEQVETPTARSNLELRHLRRILNSTVFPGGLIGSSPAIAAIHQLIEKTVDRDFQVLIPGETGTGKELVTRCVHSSGARKNSPFVAVDFAQGDCRQATPLTICTQAKFNEKVYSGVAANLSTIKSSAVKLRP